MARSSTPPQFRNPNLEEAGAISYACDFQVHAPPDWRDGPSGKSQEDYLRDDFLPRVFASGRNVIGVPQHNGIAADGGAKCVRDLARQLRSDGRLDIPIVFPGYELTSADQLQVILLAGPDENESRDLDVRIHQSLRLGQNGKQWHESALNMEALLTEARESFSDRLVRLVVATGHKGILEDGDAVTRNRELYRKCLELADGVILGGAFSQCHERVRRVLRGELAAYGSRRCPYLQSSDADSFNDLI
jgi:hypothetical protein